MKRPLRWIGMALASLAGLGIIAYAVTYALSERIVRRTYEVPAMALSIPMDPALIIGGCGGRPSTTASPVAMASRPRE